MKATFTRDDFEIIHRDVIHQGFLQMMRYQLRFRLFNGGWSSVVTRELMERQSAVAIILYDPDLDRVVLIEQFRPGATKDPQSPWLLEVVAGVINPAETPDQVATREAQEESGCEVLDLYPICEYFVSPGGSNEYLWLFCGRINASNTGGIHGLHYEDEDIRTITLTFDEAFNLLKEGYIKTSPAIISIQWLQLNREWLRQLWQKK
jgi:ADP-ribose pyrophosphatase